MTDPPPPQELSDGTRIPPDPTKNVMDLVQAANQRQDDLRRLHSEALRREMELRAAFDEKLRQAESARIDAIRAVDAAQVQRAAEVQAAQALALAGQVSAQAEAMRSQVAAAAVSSEAKLTAALEPIKKDVADLRRSQYETAGGKTQVVESRATTGETRLNLGAVWGAASVFLVFVFGIASVAIALTR